MWPFSRKFPPRETISLKERWQHIEGEYRGETIRVRLRKGLKKLAGHPEYPFHTGIVILRESGPVGEDLQKAVEAEIENRFCQKNTSLLIGVITTASQIEFILFTADPEAAKNSHQPLRDFFPDLEIEMIIQADPDWAAYRRFGASASA